MHSLYCVHTHSYFQMVYTVIYHNYAYFFVCAVKNKTNQVKLPVYLFIQVNNNYKKKKERRNKKAGLLVDIKVFTN